VNLVLGVADNGPFYATNDGADAFLFSIVFLIILSFERQVWIQAKTLMNLKRRQIPLEIFLYAIFSLPKSVESPQRRELDCCVSRDRLLHATVNVQYLDYLSRNDDYSTVISRQFATTDSPPSLVLRAHTNVSHTNRFSSHSIKVPYFSYIHLLPSALCLLPSYTGRVTRQLIEPNASSIFHKSINS